MSAESAESRRRAEQAIDDAKSGKQWGTPRTSQEIAKNWANRIDQIARQKFTAKHFELEVLYAIREATNELEREVRDLREKLAAAEKDAERYRWLREATFPSSKIMADGYYGERLDDEIDAARAAQSGEGKQ